MTGYANIEYCEQLLKKEIYGLLNNKTYGYVLGNNSPVLFSIQAAFHGQRIKEWDIFLQDIS